MLHLGDCLDVMQDIPDGSVDAVICDPPFGTTNCKWDSVIPFEPMWAQLKRIVKPNGAIVLMASQPFTSALVMSNVGMFKYCWVWEKSRPTGHVHSKNKPMKKHEDIAVFSTGTTAHAAQSKTRMRYNPQDLINHVVPILRKNYTESHSVMLARPSHRDTFQEFGNYPTSVLKIASEGKTVHPTQKPVALMEYLIRTYTNAGETVLDFTMGSGTTGVAAANTARRFIGIEIDADYFAVAQSRIRKAQADAITNKMREASNVALG